MAGAGLDQPGGELSGLVTQQGQGGRTELRLLQQHPIHLPGLRLNWQEQNNDNQSKSNHYFLSQCTFK